MKCAVSSCRPTSSSVASPRPHLHFVQVCQEGLEGHELGLGNAALKIKGGVRYLRNRERALDHGAYRDTFQRLGALNILGGVSLASGGVMVR